MSSKTFREQFVDAVVIIMVALAIGILASGLYGLLIIIALAMGA